MPVHTNLADLIKQAQARERLAAIRNKDPNTVFFRDNVNKYGAKGAFKAAVRYTDAMKNHYETPQFRYLRDHMDNLDMVGSARLRASGDFKRAFEQNARQSSRYALNPTQAQTDHNVNLMNMRSSLGVQQTINSARLQQDSVRNAIQGSLIDYGSGELKAGSEMVTESYNNYNQMKNAEAAAKKQQQTQMVTTAITVAAMAAMFM